MPVAISIKYRPNCAALSEVPRAANMMNRGRSFSKREHRARKVLSSSRSAVSRTAGCSRISSSMSDMGSPVSFRRIRGRREPAPHSLEVILQAELDVAGARRGVDDAFTGATKDVHRIGVQREHRSVERVDGFDAEFQVLSLGKRE